MKKLLSAILCAVEVIGAHAATSWVQYDTTTKRITLPTNLFMANTSALTAALTAAGWTQGIGTNASRIFFDGTAVDSPNILSGPEILLTIAGVTNITPTIKTNSIGTNQFNNTTYAAIFSGAIAESRVDAAIARLLSPAFTGSPTAPTAADGTSNTVVATTAWVLRNAGAGGGGNANTNNSQAWAAATTNTFNGRVVVTGQLEVADLIINAATYTGVWGFANGGLGVTNAADARTVLGLVIGSDVQAYDADLLQIASVAWASGDFAYRDGTGLTNFASGTTGRDLLAAANAAAARTTIGSVNVAGDTMTGPLLIPYVAYSANWTNSGTNYAPTMRAVAEKIEALSLGGYIASVSSDFQVSGSQLSLTNAVGSGRVVRETATGATASMSGLSDVALSSTNNLHKGDFFSWSGSNWVQTLGPMGVVTYPDQWEENWFNAPGTASAFGYSLSAISSGGTGNNPGWLHGRAGYNRLTAANAVGMFYCGGSFTINSQAFAPTNEWFGKLEVLFPTTNTVNQNLGFHDQLASTNACIDGLYLSVTNGVMKFVASMASSTTVGSGSYVIDTNMWHTAYFGATNQVAVVRVTTNGVVAFEDSISSVNVPGGGTVLTDFGCNAYSTGVGATNGQFLLVLKRLGMRYRVY